MSLASIVISFTIATIAVIIISIIIRMRDQIERIDNVGANNYEDFSVSPVEVNRVNNMKSAPNMPFRNDESTCLEYLNKQAVNKSGEKSENTILACLGDKI